MIGSSVPQKRPASRAPSSSSSSKEVITISDDDEPQNRASKRPRPTPPFIASLHNDFQRHMSSAASALRSAKPSSEKNPFHTQSRVQQSLQKPQSQSSAADKSADEDQNNDLLNKFLKGGNNNSSRPTPGQKKPSNLQSHNTAKPAIPSFYQSNAMGNVANGEPTKLSQQGSSLIDSRRLNGTSHPNDQPEPLGIPSDSEEDVDDLDILKHFRPTNLPKGPVAAVNTTNKPRSSPRLQTPEIDNAPRKSLKLEVKPQSITAPQKSPNFQLSVPIRPSPSPAKFQHPKTPILQSNLQLVVPRSESKEDFEAKKAKVFEELKKDTNLATQDQGTVQRYFGSNGFSESFSVDDLTRGVAKTTIYLRDVPDFSEVELDFGEWSPPTPEYDKHGNLKRVPSLTPEEMVKILLDERFERYSEDPKLTFRNDIDDRHIPGRFEFVDWYIFRDGVRQAPPNTNTGCSCVDECIPTQCECLLKTTVENGVKSSKRVQTYMQHSGDPDLVVLSPGYIANELRAEAQHYEITECNELCGCDPSCWNRTVSNGRTVPLEIYMTERCGFGVRSSIDIRQGQFIDLYLGEVITQRELELREEIKHPGIPSYVYSLDWFSNTNIYHIDGAEYGSAMRFVNHCCSPNTRSFPVQKHKADKRVYSIAFFAIKDIPAGEQITIDYCPQEALAAEPDVDVEPLLAAAINAGKEQEDMYDAPDATTDDETKAIKQFFTGDDWSDSEDEGNAKSQAPRAKVAEEEEGRVLCYCGAPNCRTYLWPKFTGRQRKRRRRLN